MGRLSQYLPSHKRLDFSFMFDANLGTLEAFIHKSKKKWLQVLFYELYNELYMKQCKTIFVTFSKKNNH